MVTCCLHPSNEVDIGLACQACLILKVPKDVVGGAITMMLVQQAAAKVVQSKQFSSHDGFSERYEGDDNEKSSDE